MAKRVGRTVALAIALASLSAPALAEDRAACREAFEQSQVLRDEGKLTVARQKLMQCTRVCPAGFQKPCEQWLVEVEASLPSVVLRAADERGQDLAAVAVTIDGARVAERLEGKSIALDPGPHSIRFEAAGRPAIVKDVVVVEGEKNRLVEATMGGAVKAEPAPSDKSLTRVPVPALIAGGVGIAALGAFAYFGLAGNADHDALVESCSRTASCTQDDKDGVKQKWLIADVFLGVGLVSLGVATVLWLTHDRRSTSAVRSSPRARPTGPAFSF